MKGYKIFDSKWQCRGTQYRVGEITCVVDPPVLCVQGLHFCARAIDCIAYKECTPDNKYAEVLAVGDIISDGDKSATNALKVVRELTHTEFLNLCTGVQTLIYFGLQTVTPYIKGKIHGCKLSIWVGDGSKPPALLQESMHKNGVPDGITRTWYAYGRKQSETNFRDGVIHGLSKTWTEEGRKIEIIYTNGTAEI